MPEFRMPSLGADMQAGTLSRWLVKPGDAVTRGQIVAVVETDKAEIEVECFDSGVVEQLLVEEGVKVPVGAALARLATAGAVTVPAAAAPAPPPPPPPAAVVVPSPAAPTISALDIAPMMPPAPPPVKPPRVPPASPLARRLAAIAGIDMSTLQGSGPGGVIVRRDVMAAQEKKAVPAAPTAPEPAALESRLHAMRDATGALMARSKREIPHYYLQSEVDLGNAMAWLAEANAARPVARRLLPAVLLLKAAALACHDVPDMNGYYSDGAFTPSPQVHLGVAISLRQGGLIAPALHDADTRSLDDLMGGLLDLVKRARVAVLRSSEMTDATITVTNLGDQGAGAVFGVIYPPQVALVGFGRITDRVVARGGMIAIRPTVTVTLSADHRVSDGHRGSLYLAAVARLLQEPEKL